MHGGETLKWQGDCNKKGIANRKPVAKGTCFVLDQVKGSPMTKAMERQIELAATTRFPVLILGERGCGKRTAAKLIHTCSDIREAPFTEIAAEELSTGLAANRTANAALHSKGTVYLTQCGKLSPVAQRELTALLQQDSPSAGGRARVIGSAGPELAQILDTGCFREDLYYALSTIFMIIPPLRHRRADILSIADYLLERYASLFQRRKPRLGPDSTQFLLQQRWPGNVSQLEELTKILVAIEDESVAIAAGRSVVAEFAAKAGAAPAMSLKEAARGAARAAERGVIEQALLRTDWNRKRAAEQLQVSYKALLYKVRQFGLEQVTEPSAR